VPTVIDRLIQQALHQVLQPLFEPTFSDSSFGFRPRRGAHQAVRIAQGYIREGKRWVVDIDLEKFLDASSHYVSRCFEGIKEVGSNCRYLYSQAFCATAIDMHGLEFAALYNGATRFDSDFCLWSLCPVATAARSKRTSHGQLRASCDYLAFALAAAAVLAEGSAKAITASPNVKLKPGLPPKP
jgi:hypothetical protein